MTCTVCSAAMYRVVNEKGTAHATCSRCAQWVDCAECQGHIVICPPCWAKLKTPRKPEKGPLVQDSEPF